MKQKLAKFALFVYLNHIQEDWDMYKPIGKIVFWPAWFVRSILIWILSPLLIPEYLFKQSQVYKQFQKTGVAPTPEQMKQMQEMNKLNTKLFLHQTSDRRKK